MIVEGITGLTFWFLGGLFEGFQIISLPVNAATVLIDLLKVGVWVLGHDLFALVMASVIFWLTFKFTAGLLLFIWRLLPLT